MRFLILAPLMFLPWPALAGETAWQELAPNARARLISSDVQTADGTTLVGLELDMPETVKTYWRVPGETGIPTELNLNGSTGIAAHTIEWPYPVIDEKYGYVDFVYYGPTVLPVSLKLDGSPAQLEAAVVMGVCSDICVPVSAKFSLPLHFGAPDRAQGLRIGQAMAKTPIPWDDAAAEPITEVGFDAAAEALRVRIGDRRIDAASLIATFAAGSPLFGAPQKSPEPDIVLLPLLGNAGDKGFEGEPVQFTFMTDDGPYEVSRRIAPLASAGGQSY